MAPSLRPRAQRQHASTNHPSVDTTTDGAPLLPNCHSPDGDRRPSPSIDKPGDLMDARAEAEPQQSRALVLGKPMLVPQTYDPDTYDPDGPVPWTPEPEPYDAETYAAWGRKHFGEEWYKLRETMLRERNIYRDSDPIYLERQKAIRVMEHKIEGRPFRPSSRVYDDGWQRLWSRLSKVLPRVQPPTPASSVADDGDSDTNLSGFSTYEPTPEPREPSPLPNDPWERLEHERKRSCWSEEEYQFERIFRKEDRIDIIRAKHENQEGDRQREKELEEMRKVRYYPGTGIQSIEYERLKRRFQLRAEGWTQEQIDAKDRAAKARAREMEIEREKKWNTPPKTLEELIWKFRVWDLKGISREEQDRLGRMHGFPERPPIPDTIGNPMEKRSPPRDQEEMDRLFDFWDGALSRAEQDELACMYGFSPRQAGTDRHAGDGVASRARAWPLWLAKDTPAPGSQGPKNAPQRPGPRAARSRRPAPTPGEAMPPDQKRRPSGPDASEKLSDKTQAIPRGPKRQRKTYEKQRQSRRLAGHSPEFGLLGETQSLSNASPQVSNTRKTGRPGVRTGRPPKKPTAKGKKPRGISKSPPAESGRSRRSARGSRK